MFASESGATFFAATGFFFAATPFLFIPAAFPFPIGFFLATEAF
jgi:hypothetical protein